MAYVLILIFAVALAITAKVKGYNPIIWFCLGFVPPPYMAFVFLILAFLPSKQKGSIKNKPFYSNVKSAEPPAPENLFPCIDCGRMIPINAAVCKYCGKKYDIIDTKSETKNDK